MKKYISTLTGLLVSTFFVCGEISAADGEKPLNVMFIIVDDLRAELGSYGCDQMKTPNFDRLARSSMQFRRAATKRWENLDAG